MICGCKNRSFAYIQGCQLTVTLTRVEIIGVEEPDDGHGAGACVVYGGQSPCVRIHPDTELELYFVDVDGNKVFGAGVPHHRTYTNLTMHCDEG